MARYLFGMWDTLDDFINEGQEGLRLDPVTRAYTGNVRYVDSSDYQESDLRNSPEFYEVDTSKPLLDQVDLNKMTTYVNQSAIGEYRAIQEDLTTKLDLGGITEKDRIKATEDPSGIFSFGLAAPTLYRMVEWYIYDTDSLADLDKGATEKVGGEFYYRENRTAANPNPKQYRCRRQQKGTYDMLKHVVGVKLIEVGESFFAADKTVGIGTDGNKYTLKFGTQTRKIYLKREKKGGAPKYIDIFVIAGGLGGLNSDGMMAKITPVVMLAQQLEQGGAKVRIYGMRAYNKGEYAIFYSWVAKEYGAPIDINAIATSISDPRFFRWAMWQNSEGVTRKRYGLELNGYGSTIYGGDDLKKGFALYKNYLENNRKNGLNKTKVTNKALYITGGLPDPQNDWDSNRDAIMDEFYRISDMSEILLAEKPDKAIRRIIKREKDNNKSEAQIRQRLERIVDDAFYAPVQPAATAATKPYLATQEEIDKMQERKKEIEEALRRNI